jgi:putative inorganic carbon (HCO3(-)) transporter
MNVGSPVIPGHSYRERVHASINVSRPLTLTVLAVSCAGIAAISVYLSEIKVLYGLALFMLFCFGAVIAVFPGRYWQMSSVYLAVACGIGVQFRLFTHGVMIGEYRKHLGGAAPEPVINFIDVPIALIVGAALAAIAVRRAFPYKWTRFDTIVVLFIASSFLSIRQVADFPCFFLELFRYVKYALLYWALRIALDKKGVERILFVGFAYMLCAETVVALAQYFGGFTLPFMVGGVGDINADVFSGITYNRTTGLIGHCNAFAAWLLCPLCLALTVLFLRVKIRYKAAAAALFCAGLLVICSTFSRNGMLSFLFCVGVVTCICVMKKRMTVSGFFIGIALSALAAYYVVSTGLFHMMLLRFITDEGGPTQGRIQLIQVALSMIRSHPLSGVGLNNFDFVMDRYDMNGISVYFNDPVHTIFLLVWSETGLATLLCFCAMGVFLVSRGLRLVQTAVRETDFLIGTVSVAVFLGLAFNGLMDYTLRNELVMAQVTILAALVMHSSVKSGPDALRG